MRRPARRQLHRARLPARLLSALRGLPLAWQLALLALELLTVGSSINFAYQVARKPAELFFPVSGALDKTPAQTWRQYGPIFRAHSTDVITPDFLAALAQVEGAGNPVARTYWRWRLTVEPWEIYRPASSAVGMYQITDGTFREAKRYCIRDHAVVEDGPWHDWRSCWFNGFYTRVLPGHAAELTSAFLDRRVAEILAGRPPVALQQKQDLAAVVHLCGAAAGEAYVRRGFRPLAGQRCGSHPVAGYLARVNTLKKVFHEMAKNDERGRGTPNGGA